jgi:NhaA family Na+:H+ antiporter
MLAQRIARRSLPLARRPTLEFLKTEAASGLVLALAALAALALANSPWAAGYYSLIHAQVPVRLGPFQETAELIDWVKQGLMAIFFFVVGMEIKFEILKGELANPRRLALPVLAALGGMILPAFIYLACNTDAPVVHGAWAVPTATDVAFALAALSASSRRLPGSLRIFLLTLAIADDLGAVGLIGVLFSEHIRPGLLAGAGVVLLAMAGLGRWRAAPFLFYAAAFALAWGFTLKSGVSTSVVAVLAALTVPIGPRRRGQDSVLRHFMDSLRPYVGFGVLPLFAFMAAGFSLRGLMGGHLGSPVTVGILLGLFLGKQVGVFLSAFIAVTFGLGRKPTSATWLEVWGVSLLCGVGFTMSLFMSALAFPGADIATQNQARLGVTLGSLMSAAAGMAVLAWAGRRREQA